MIILTQTISYICVERTNTGSNIIAIDIQFCFSEQRGFFKHGIREDFNKKKTSKMNDIVQKGRGGEVVKTYVTFSRSLSSHH